MKMRVRGNSIRLRLTQSDVAELIQKGFVEEAVEFGGASRLIYALRSASGAETICAEFEDNRLAVIVPEKEAREWANSEQISLEGKQNIGGDKVLRLLIEKDFACLAPRAAEEDADAFPNPAGNLKC